MKSKSKLFKPTVKYEVVFGDAGDTYANGGIVSNSKLYRSKWMEYAGEYFDETGTYISAIANEGYALYNEEWGCPLLGEETITFNCTANPEFIKDMELYEAGVLYITNKLKEFFKQSTVTITKLESTVKYITNSEEE